MQHTEHVVRVGPHRGGMSLFIDGAPRPFTFFKITETPDTAAMLEAAAVEIPDLARAGVTLCWVPIFIDWTAPGRYDFSDLDRRVSTVLSVYDAHTPAGDPPACVGVRIQAAVFHPAWYVDAARDARGRPTNTIEFRNPWGAVDGRETTCAISPGDPFWDTHALDCLRAIVDHVRAAPYADRVFGWLPCAFNSNEWFIRTFVPEAACDYSAPAQAAFRAHLASRGMPAAGSPVPSPDACNRPGRGEFLDPAGDGRMVEEFSLWLNGRMADILLNFAAAVRERCAGSPKAVGFFYGYTTELSFFQNLSQSGHLGLRRVLDSDAVDFICSPCQYRYRHDEGPFTYGMVLGPFAHSAAEKGKLAFAEDDHQPVFAKTVNTDCATRDRWHDEMFFRRNFAQVLASGQQMWWYSLGASWFREEYRRGIVRDLHRVAVEAMETDRSPVAETAVVVDERSVQTMRLNAPFQGRLILDGLASFFPTGAPVECHELGAFLDGGDRSRFRTIAFLNLFLADPETVRRVDALKSGGRTLIFFFTPGFLAGAPGGRSFSVDAASRMAGMALREETERIPLTVWMDPDRVPFAAGRDIRYGWINPENPAGPVLAIADDRAVPLGFLHSGRPGFGMRRHPGWTSVFSAAPGIPPSVLKMLLADAGVHIYTGAEDVIHANRSMVAYVSCSRGEKELVLPFPAELDDVLTGETLGPAAARRRLFMKRHETRIFRIRPAAPEAGR